MIKDGDDNNIINEHDIIDDDSEDNNEDNIEDNNEDNNEDNIEDNNDVPIKKKRGRKPKIRNESSEPIINIEKVKKKRGRKPKNKFNVETTIEDTSSLSLNTVNHIIKIPVEAIEDITETFELLDNNFTSGFTTDINNLDNIDYNQLDYNPNEFALHDYEKSFEESLREFGAWPVTWHDNSDWVTPPMTGIYSVDIFAIRECPPTSSTTSDCPSPTSRGVCRTRFARA